MIASSTRRLLTDLAPLRQLNPYAAEPLRPAWLELAGQVPEADFPAVSEFAEELLGRFLAAPWKRSEKELMKDFSECLRNASKQLREAGASTPPTPLAAADSPHSVALALPQSFSALEWFNLLAASEVPARLRQAVDAVVRRNHTTPTVLPAIFEVLFRIDSARTFEWMNRFLEERRGRLDQDVVRDFLHSWRKRDRLPQASVNWVFEWCGNEDLRQQWPAVAEEADAVLRGLLLKQWLPKLRQSRSALLRQFSLLGGKTGGAVDGSVRQWQERAIQELGDAVVAFIGFSRGLDAESGGSHSGEGTGGDWSRPAIFRELLRIESLFAPVVLFADLWLALPDGAYAFALALLGFPAPELKLWREDLLRETTGMVHHAIMADIKADRQPLATIKLYSLGDRQLFRYLTTQLDLVSRHFGSLAQRDKVVEQLALHFASLREAQLLPRALTRRYRKLVLTLHEDNLRRLLDREQFEESNDFVVRRDLLAVAAAARRYIQRRRALHTSPEEMVGSRFDFEKTIRQKRLQFARELSGKN